MPCWWHRLPPPYGHHTLLLADMMKASPHLMTKALGLHNYAIRKACHANAGHVLEQEGDSYCIAFHRPLEAVAFCLQVGAPCGPVLRRRIGRGQCSLGRAMLS